MSTPTASPPRARPVAPPVPAPVASAVQAGFVMDRFATAAFANAVYQVARKEFLQHIRTKRLLIIGGMLLLFMGIVTLGFGPSIAENIGRNLNGVISLEHFILTFYFGVGLIGGLQFTQLLAIVLTSDAVCSEWSNRTIFLLLSKPVSRAAFVTGKFVGNLFTIAVTLVTLFTLTYIVMQPLYDGSPSGEEVWGFFGMLGIVVLGAAAFASISLFVSTLTKSTVTSLLIVLSLWLLIFPMLGATGTFIQLGSDQPFEQESLDSVEAWRYLNPASDMQAGARLLVPADNPVGDIQEMLSVINPFGVAAKEIWIAVLALLGYTVVFFAAALFMVQRRNFE